MSWCVVTNCFNTRQKNKGTKGFFAIPKDEKIRKQWEHAIGRKSLPSGGAVCSDHFEEDCFDKSWDMQIDLNPSYSERPIKRKLNKDAVPSIFPHKEGKKEERQPSKYFQNSRNKEVSQFIMQK